VKLIPPKRIDGVSTDPHQEGPYNPKGILSHEYYPLETVFVTEYGNDLSYMASYWAVDKIWQLFIRNRDTYERLRDKLLQQRVVVVDYNDMNNLGIYIPKHRYISGIEELFKTVLDDLRQMDREALDKHLADINAHTIEDVLKSHYERI